jgi:hypothetical protein
LDGSRARTLTALLPITSASARARDLPVVLGHGEDERTPDGDDHAVQHPVARRATTILACLIVMFVLIAPDQPGQLALGAFARLPVEGLALVAVALVLPGRAARFTAVIVGAGLGLLAILKILDLGFYTFLDRPFDPVLDWAYLANAMDYLTESISRAAAVGVAIIAGALAVAVLVVMALSVVRLSGLVLRFRTEATIGVMVLGVVWVTCATLGLEVVTGEPIAARSAATLAFDRARQARTSLNDHRAFTRELAVDPFRVTPSDQLLTALRGKNVIVAFVESYGRSAIEDPALAPGIDAVLDAGTQQLREAGFASRSGWLTSPTAGGGSWLAHSTLLSGLWVDNQHRDQDLVGSDRLTLTKAFRRAGWRVVAVMPGTTKPWAQGAFYGYDKIYTAHDLGYRGPPFSWAPMPDQYALSAFQRSELGKPGQTPVMAEVVLVSSHAPWAPIPRLVTWTDVGDGSVYDPMPAAGNQPDDVWPDPIRVRRAYGRSIQYSLSSLISYLRLYGTDDTVLVFLGDHQPAPVVTGEDASREVPITIVAREPVLDRTSGWGWQDGLRPGARAPVWRMDAFRDRFMTAFAR